MDSLRSGSTGRTSLALGASAGGSGRRRGGRWPSAIDGKARKDESGDDRQSGIVVHNLDTGSAPATSNVVDRQWCCLIGGRAIDAVRAAKLRERYRRSPDR